MLTTYDGDADVLALEKARRRPRPNETTEPCVSRRPRTRLVKQHAGTPR